MLFLGLSTVEHLFFKKRGEKRGRGERGKKRGNRRERRAKGREVRVGKGCGHMTCIYIRIDHVELSLATLNSEH